jgi:hypothetical protein
LCRNNCQSRVKLYGCNYRFHSSVDHINSTQLLACLAPTRGMCPALRRSTIMKPPTLLPNSNAYTQAHRPSIIVFSEMCRPRLRHVDHSPKRRAVDETCVACKTILQFASILTLEFSSSSTCDLCSSTLLSFSISFSRAARTSIGGSRLRRCARFQRFKRAMPVQGCTLN